MPDQYRITVLGNCGRTHPTFEDWQRCKACDPRQPQWPTFDQACAMIDDHDALQVKRD